MNKEKKNLIRKAHVSRLSVTHGCFHGNNDISQQIWLDIRPISFLHGKRDYVSWTVTMQILIIDRSDFLVVHKNQADFFFSAIKKGDGLLEDRSYFSQIQGDFLLLFGDDQSHYAKPLSHSFLFPPPVPGRQCDDGKCPSVS